MTLLTRYRISDQSVPEIRSFPMLAEIPYFLRHHKNRLRSINEMVAIVSNRSHSHPTFVNLNAFHRHETPYAAIDALAMPLAEFFIQTDILPIVEPLFDRFKDLIEELAPGLYRTFADRGILIGREALG